MEAWLVAIVAVVALAAVSIVAIRDRRMLARVRDLAGGPAGTPAGSSTAIDPVSAIAALRDRADRLETDLATERRDAGLFVESLAQGVLTVDAGLRIVGANGISHAFLDRAPGSLIGRSIIEAFIDVGVEQIARTALDQGSATGEFRLTDADGPKLVIRARRSSSGGLWLVLEDVSELRRLQQIRAEFIDNLSHELRTPLTTVSVLAETLARDADAAGDAVPAKMRERIGKIEVETGHLVQMVSELLDLSRIESGGGLGVVDQVDIGQIARESTERLRLFADRQGVTLHVDVPSAVPPVRGDGARIGQVFVNLLHNAVKFSPDGGDVRVTVQRAESEVVTAIADEGVGIPRSAQARIFERFYKVDRARVRGEVGGTGLGLAIARHIVEQHGGRIWVESDEGVGSTFLFSIPVAAVPV